MITCRLLKIKRGHHEGVQKMYDCGWHGLRDGEALYTAQLMAL